MNKKQFMELTGENPEDVLGNDWKNEIEDLNDHDCSAGQDTGCNYPEFHKGE